MRLLLDNWSKFSDNIKAVVEAKTTVKDGKVIEIDGSYTAKTKVIKLNADKLNEPKVFEEIVLHEF